MRNKVQPHLALVGEHQHRLPHHTALHNPSNLAKTHVKISSQYEPAIWFVEEVRIYPVHVVYALLQLWIRLGLHCDYDCGFYDRDDGNHGGPDHDDHNLGRGNHHNPFSAHLDEEDALLHLSQTLSQTLWKHADQRGLFHSSHTQHPPHRDYRQYPQKHMPLS